MVALGIMVVVGASDFTYPERYSKTSGYETGVCRTAEAIGSLASSKLAVPMHMKITIPPQGSRLHRTLIHHLLLVVEFGCVPA